MLSVVRIVRRSRSWYQGVQSWASPSRHEPRHRRMRIYNEGIADHIGTFETERKAGFDFHCNWPGRRMMVCSGFSGLATALSAKPIGRDEASAASITSRRRADWIMATSYFREAYPLVPGKSSVWRHQQWRHLSLISRILEAHGRPQGRYHELIALGDPRLET